MKKYTVLAAALLLAFACLTGCQSPRTAGMGADVYSQTDSEALDAHIFFDSVSFARHLEFTRIDSKRNAMGNLTAQVELRNLDSRSYTAVYCFAWFDENGLEIEPEKIVWHPVSFTGGQRRTLQQTSVYPNATDFRLVIRQEKNLN